MAQINKGGIFAALVKKPDSDKDRLLREAFIKIKEEMNDHLDAINENTSELGSTNEYVAELEERLGKLCERLEQLELKIGELSGQKVNDYSALRDIVLSTQEEEVFFMLYSRTGDLLDYREISKQTGLTEELCQRNISSLVSKGIPVVKKYFDGKTLLILDPDFRNLQAKENIIKMKKN